MTTNTLETSYSDFVAQLAALNISGVVRRYTEPPQQVNSTDLPIQYVELPNGSEGAMTTQAAGGWPNMVCGLVVLMKPVMQDTYAPNFAASVAMIDAVSTALRGAYYLGKASPNWTTRVEIVNAGNSQYWAVTTEVRVNG